MEIMNLVQGSDEWLESRLRSFTASEAAAMMNQSKHASRNELLRMKATGNKKEVSGFVQKFIFDKGHNVEASARAILEDELDVDLFPVTAKIDIDGMSLLASYDGLEDYNRKWSLEHKQWNKELPQKVEAGELDPDHYWQMEHQILVGDLDYVLFVVSDGTIDNRVSHKYISAPKRRKALIAGWHQFAEDLANYEVKEIKTAPEGTAIKKLPTLAIKLSGGVESSNLAVFEQQANALIERVKTDLVTDQDFADAEKIVKFCASAEKEIDTAKSAALAQTASIDDLFRTLDHVKEQLRQTRLTLNKKVNAEKLNRKQEILDGGYAEVNSAHANAMAELSHNPDLPHPDLNAEIKNKRTLESIQNAVDSAIAAWKIEFREACATVARNEKAIAGAGDYRFLFNDSSDFINKEPEYVEMLVKTRIADHKKAEQERIQAEAEAAAEKERERIRKEEEARAWREAEAAAEKERERIRKEEEARAWREAEAAAEKERERIRKEEEAKAQAAANEKLAMEQVHANNEAVQSNKTDAGSEGDQAALEGTLEATHAAPVTGDEPAKVQPDSEDPRASTNRMAMMALTEKGIDKDIAKHVITLVARGMIPGMAMHYPPSEKMEKQAA